MNKDTIGNRLKTVRVEHELSQRELAAEMGVSNSTISRIEKDESLPDTKTLIVPDTDVEDMISRQAAIDALDCINGVEEVLRSLPSAEPTITHEQAINYLHKTGWLQNHDRILTEIKVPLKGIWKDFTDEGYVECPFCKSATNCESKEDIDELHFCFSCGAMLKRGEANAAD